MIYLLCLDGGKLEITQESCSMFIVKIDDSDQTLIWTKKKLHEALSLPYSSHEDFVKTK